VSVSVTVNVTKCNCVTVSVTLNVAAPIDHSVRYLKLNKNMHLNIS
jgi:hypothetical protein